jgi:hypothetical protein
LKQEKNKSINFLSSLQINFEENEYEILTRFDNIIVQNSLNTQLTDSDINEIVKSEVKRHKEFIEQKIAEKENK